MKIALNHWPEHVRSSAFSLCLQDGCVFADFGRDSEGRVYLLRISYDGHGCCPTNGNVRSMSDVDSALISASVADGNLDNDHTRDILFRYFNTIKNRIWPDALSEHGLLPK